MQHNDKRLNKQLNKQLEADLEAQYTAVFKFLRGLCHDEHLAEELTQETIYKAWKNISTFKGDSDFRVWLCSIAKNTYYTWYNKQKNHISFDELNDGVYNSADSDDSASSGTSNLLPSHSDDTLLKMIDKESVLAIHKELHNLDEPYKEIFSLRVFGELSFKEIGELFEKSEHWACVTYHRARIKISERLRQKEGNI